MTTSKNPNIANFKFLFHIFQVFKAHIGLPWWLSGKESACQCRRPRFDPPVRKIPWRRYWQPTPVFLPGKFHEKRNLVVYSPWGRKETDMAEQLKNNNIETYFHEIDDFHLRWS